ncbi:hypothetical protein Tco_1548019 [Tanacetum coccineum]
MCGGFGFQGKIKHEDVVLKFWKKSLNSLTWIEILRQVLVATGFGSNRDTSLKEHSNKLQEATLMARYFSRPGTLKGALFTILLLQGNDGMKIPELATSSSISARLLLKNFLPSFSLQLFTIAILMENFFNVPVSISLTISLRFRIESRKFRWNLFSRRQTVSICQPLAPLIFSASASEMVAVIRRYHLATSLRLHRSRRLPSTSYKPRLN